MGLLDKALNIGEGKQFRQYEKRVAAIGAQEAELMELSDADLRGRMDALRERVQEQGEHLDDVLSASASRSSARPAGARWACATSTSS